MSSKVGARLGSTVCQTEVIVVRSSGEGIDLRCGGAPMVPLSGQRDDGAPAPGFSSGTLLGKRYVDENAQIEVLCTKPGAGSLSVGEIPLQVAEAKLLPSSD
jgi:hypothetical protein